MSKNVVVIGGHGKVALRLARLLSPSNQVTSAIRSASEEQQKAVRDAGASPVVLSLEDGSSKDFQELFERTEANAVYFCAGAGYIASEERIKKVEYEGIVKICDAIEAVDQNKRPRFMVISALDIRNPDKIPEHYTEADRKVSERIRGIMPQYFKWRYEADKSIVSRTAFGWTILRPGGLTDEPGVGKVSLGKAHLSVLISRDDLALVLAALLNLEDAAGLAIDTVGGRVPVEEAVSAFISRGVTDWLG